MKSNDNSFANNLKTILKEKKISQKFLADLIGLKPTTISRYINCSNEPSLEIIIKMASCLNVTTDELLGLKKSDISLSKDEQGLINAYRSLPENGKLIAKKQLEILKKNI